MSLSLSSSSYVPGGFTRAQYEVLSALVDTFCPSLPHIAAQQTTPEKRDYYLRGALDLGVAKSFAQDIGRLPPDLGDQLKKLLWLLSTAPGTLILTGHIGPFQSLSLETRINILGSWSTSSLAMKRGVFTTFRQIAGRLFFAITDEKGFNPNWSIIGYPGPAPAIVRAASFNIPTFDFKFTAPPEFGKTLQYDVVIVGSGCGGGVVASEVAKAGFKVLVLEKSTYVKREDMTLLELQSMNEMYENSGIFPNEESGISVLAGSTFGGGSTINWGAALRTPKHVTDEWAKDHGCKNFASQNFQESLDFVEKRLGVHTSETVHNSNNAYLKNGCDILKYKYNVIPRNAPGTHACGYCPFGCKSGEKQGCVQTFLADAAVAGADFMTEVYVDKVIHKNNQAVGVVAINKHGVKFVIKSKVVVLSAGSIHSPALMLRSEIPNPNIGKNLRLHPVSMAYGLVPEQTAPWDGCMMSIVCKEFENRKGSNYGCLIETPPTHPGSAAAVLPWKSPDSVRTAMLRFTNMVFLIILVRDRESGSVTIDANGRPRISYNISNYDFESLQQGMDASLKILTVSGADTIATVHASSPSFRPVSKDPDHPDLQAFLRKVRDIPYQTCAYPLFSAHQMGTCRMGGNRDRAVLRETGESWDVKNLFVADASTFPTSSGVNPMVTTLAISHSVAQNVTARLRQIAKL